MAKLWIREYGQVASAPASPSSERSFPYASGAISVPNEPGTDQAPVTFTTSTRSAAFADGTAYVGIIADAAFHYVVGATPTATTGRPEGAGGYPDLCRRGCGPKDRGDRGGLTC